MSCRCGHLRVDHAGMSDDDRCDYCECNQFTSDPGLCEMSGATVLASYRVTEDPGTAKCPLCEQICRLEDGMRFRKHRDDEPRVIVGQQ